MPKSRAFLDRLQNQHRRRRPRFLSNRGRVCARQRSGAGSYEPMGAIIPKYWVIWLGLDRQDRVSGLHREPVSLRSNTQRPATRVSRSAPQDFGDPKPTAAVLFCREHSDATLDLRPIGRARSAQVVIGLQVHPKPRRSAEILRQPKRDRGGDGRTPVDNVVDWCGANVDVAGKPVLADSMRFHEFFGQYFASQW